MTSNQTIEFLLLIASAVSLWLAVFVIFPAAARSRFRLTMTEIRDACDDEFLLDGPYVDDAMIEAFWRRADVLIETASQLTLAEMLAVRASLRRAHLDLATAAPSYSHLPRPARTRMNTLERALEKACRRYLLAGSGTGWLVAVTLAATSAKAKAHLPGRHDRPSTAELMCDYEQALRFDPEMRSSRRSLVAV